MKSPFPFCMKRCFHGGPSPGYFAVTGPVPQGSQCSEFRYHGKSCFYLPSSGGLWGKSTPTQRIQESLIFETETFIYSGFSYISSGFSYISSGFSYISSGFSYISSGFSYISSGFSYISSGFPTFLVDFPRHFPIQTPSKRLNHSFPAPFVARLRLQRHHRTRHRRDLGPPARNAWPGVETRPLGTHFSMKMMEMMENNGNDTWK